jgi:DNA end-binding protein Ku
MRAIWNGHITFGLISIPVGLYPAIETAATVSFRLLHRKDRAPIRYRKFCSAENIEVGNDEIVKGYEVEKGKYALVEGEELEKIQEELGEGDKSIEVLQFVQMTSLNPLSFDKPYYLAPEKGGEKAYEVLRDALREEKRVGMARFHLRTKPQLAALLPGPEALALEVLRPFESLREPADLKIPSPRKSPAEVKLARRLIEAMSEEEWDPTEHPDEYQKALKTLLASKRKVGAREPRQRAENVIDLEEALRKSVGRRAHRGRKAPARRAGAA